MVVLFGEEGLPGARMEKISGEELIAVCSPELDVVAVSPADLVEAPLLRLSSREFADDWALWFESAGLSDPAPAQIRQQHYR